MSQVLFLVLAALTVGAALMVVLHRNPVYNALGLVSTLVLVSMFYFGLDAQLVGLLQVIVYAGAIVVLFLFVIMLLNLEIEERRTAGPGLVGLATAGAVCLVGLLLAALRRVPELPMPVTPEGFGNAGPVGERLYTHYLLPFELTSLLLLVAVVGAVAIAKRKTR